MKATELGLRIKAQRERAKLTQTELAAAAAIERTSLAKIESGSRRVAALELHRIAEALGIRMARFFEEAVPSIVSHRSSQGLDVADSQIDGILDRVAHDVELLQRLAPGRLRPEISVDLPARMESMEDADSLADSVRSSWELGADAPAENLPGLVGRLGLWAFSRDIGADSADAGTVLLETGAVAFVNSHNKVGRRRLALAHELGHFLVQDEYSIDWRVSGAEGAVESRLDRFARALLLPGQALERCWNVERGRRGERHAAVLVASHFQVDMSTLARRLGELRLEADLPAVREVRTTKTDIIELGLKTSYDLEGTTQPLAYQQAVLALYRQSRLSEGRALELLADVLSADDLPERPTRSAGEIWNFTS